MQFSRVALLGLLLVFESTMADARARRLSSSNRSRGGRRSQQQQQRETHRIGESESSSLPSLTVHQETELRDNTLSDDQPPPPPSVPPLNSRRTHQHARRSHKQASSGTHRSSHHNRRKNRSGESRQHNNESQQNPVISEVPSCPNCFNLELKKRLRIQQIKERVLTATGLIRPPNMTGVVISENPEVREIMEDVQSTTHLTTYTEEPLDSEEEPLVKTKKVFSPVDPAPADLRIPEGVDVLYFKLNHAVLGYRARRAILHVWLKPTDPLTSETEKEIPTTSPRVSISVFKVVRPRVPGDEIEMEPVTTGMESFNPYQGNWVKIEVYQLLQEWLQRPEDNLGLVLEATDPQGRQVAVTDPTEKPSNAPLLEIHTEESTSRGRRNNGNHMCTHANDHRCCRYPLIVDFVKLGWDFIVAPRRYEANFCEGECTFLYAQKYAHSAVIQKLNRTNAVHGPCCGAQKMSPLPMLYYDHNYQIKLDYIQNMIVDRCGCT